MRRLLIIGAGGHGVVVADAAEMSGKWDKIAFLDDTHPEMNPFSDWEVIGSTASLEKYSSTFDAAIVAIGDARIRLALLKKIAIVGLMPASIIHPRSCISRLAEVGEGSVFLANAVVNARAVIGQGCIVNTGATVDHDCHLSAGVHVSPGAHLAADVAVGQHSWIGAGASVREQIHIGCDATVGVGAAVVEDVPAGTVVVGVPAKPMKSNTKLQAMGL